MRLVPFQLIPDQGSIGYKLYQEAQKAKAEAAKAAAAAKAKPKVTPPKPTAANTPPAPAKPAAPATSAAEGTNVSKEAGAMDFFLNTAKAKYKEAGDRTKVEMATTGGGGAVVSAEQIRANVGNPFVAQINNNFSRILSALDGYGRNIAEVEKYQAKIAEGDMSYLSGLTMSQTVAANSKNSLITELKGIKQWAEYNNVFSEAHEFFGEYTEFTRGEKLDLLKLLDTFDVA